MMNCRCGERRTHSLERSAPWVTGGDVGGSNPGVGVYGRSGAEWDLHPWALPGHPHRGSLVDGTTKQVFFVSLHSHSQADAGSLSGTTM